MPWINLDKIPAAEFRKGYKPPDYHDIIIFSKDGRFMFPRVIQPGNFNLQTKADIVSFYDTHKEQFGIPPAERVTRASCYSFLPGPGEVRPTHVVLRHTLYNDANRLERAVLKVVNSRHGYREYRRQQDFHERGYPTPRPFLYVNYFTDLIYHLRDKGRRSLHVEIPAILGFLREIETCKRPFDDLKNPDTRARFTAVLAKVRTAAAQKDVPMLTRYIEDLNALQDGIFDGLEFKGFFFMDFIEKTLSFEQILFDVLGGKDLERESGAIHVLPWRPDFDAEFLIHDVTELILRLWNMGQCHNDFKGEHLLYNFLANKWMVIDWGELVSAGYGQDLAVLMADTNAFIEDRCKFNRMYGRKAGASSKAIENIQATIMERSSRFWDSFLARLAEHISSTTMRDAYKILRNRQLSFHAEKLAPYMA